MTNASAMGPVQAAVFAQINVPAVTNLAPVYDEVPQEKSTSYPYVEIGELEETLSNVFQKNGRAVRVHIHIFSSAPGFKEGEAILEQLNVLLDDTLLQAPTGWTCWLSEYELGTAQKEFDVIELRHLTAIYHIEVSAP